MKFAYVLNNKVQDIAAGSPSAYYSDEVALLYNTEIPDDIVRGASLDAGNWVNPAPAVIPTVIVKSPVISPIQFKMLFTQPERKALRDIRTTDEIMEDWELILEDPRLTEVDLSLDAVQGVLDYMVFLEILTEARAEDIKLGIAPSI